MAAPSIAEARTPPLRSDSRMTRDRLVVAIGQWVADHGQAPDRLADLAKSAGISVATAYRHFASIDDLIRAHVLRLPQSATERFARADRVGLTACTDGTAPGFGRASSSARLQCTCAPPMDSCADGQTANRRSPTSVSRSSRCSPRSTPT